MDMELQTPRNKKITTVRKTSNQPPGQNGGAHNKKDKIKAAQEEKMDR